MATAGAVPGVKKIRFGEFNEIVYFCAPPDL
jgi:hypothetical protein